MSGIQFVIALSVLGARAAFAAEDPSTVYSCLQGKDTELTLELSGQTAVLSGETREGRLVDVMAFRKHDFKLKQKSARFERYEAGKSYAPIGELLVEKPMRQGSAQGRLEIRYKDGAPADELKCRLADDSEG